MQRTAIADTSIIATWLKLLRWDLDIFQFLPNIAETVLVPQEVKIEIERYAPALQRPVEIQWLLRQIEENSFFKLCTTYDSVDLDFLKSLNKVDAGEAETTAQAKKLNYNWIWIDDRKCLPELKKHLGHFHFHNSLVVLHILNQSQLLPDSVAAFTTLNKAYNYSYQQYYSAAAIAHQWINI